MSMEERERIQAELYGTEREQEETDELLKYSLQAFQLCLESNTDKAEYEEAVQKCPKLVETESAPIRFLRAEHFDPKVCMDHWLHCLHCRWLHWLPSLNRSIRSSTPNSHFRFCKTHPTKHVHISLSFSLYLSVFCVNLRLCSALLRTPLHSTPLHSTPSTQKAAQRLVTYWKMRKQVFGEEKAFLPMAIDGALSEADVATLRGISEYYWVLPGPDEHGRTVFLKDKTRVDWEKYDRDCIVSTAVLPHMHYTTLHYTALHCTAPHRTALHTHTILQLLTATCGKTVLPPSNTRHGGPKYFPFHVPDKP